MKHLLSLLAFFACFASAIAQTPAQSPTPAPTPVALDLLRDKEVVDLFAKLPVQESGRVKPLDTVARFKLLRFSGKQSGIPATRVDKDTGKEVPILEPGTSRPLTDAKGKKLKFTAMEWLLVSWFRPDIGRELPVFVVDNSEAVTELGLPAKKKRDRYTYNEIVAGRNELMRKMNEVQQVEAKQRTPVQRALGKLAMDFLDYEMTLSHFDFARSPFGGNAATLPPELASHVKNGRPDWAALLPAMREFLRNSSQQSAADLPWFRDFYASVLGALMAGNEASVPRFFPPPAQKQEVWHNPGLILKGALEGGPLTAEDAGFLKRYEELYLASSDPALFKSRLKEYSAEMTRLAAARDESGHVAMEVHYHRFDYFYRALLCFTTGLLLLALSWLNPGSKWSRRFRAGCIAFTLAGSLLGTVGIVIRCLIMERPPITSLYETIIFIATTAAVLALLTEWITKRGWALTVAAVAGTAGLFLSIRFMNMEGRDTMELLEAVLITNFWLSTHVPCINLGYAAGMLAAIFSLIYVVMRLFGLAPGSSDARDMTRMAYAFVIAGLFLSLVGTVLGGIWANYSWGRFWGWDPKENGALMIVLVNLAILHARLGGYIREAGFHACCLFLGMVVAFSWFATNQLGVGLHSYGAMEGAWMWLYIFWGLMTVLMIIATVLAITDRRRPEAPHESLSRRTPATHPA